MNLSQRESPVEYPCPWLYKVIGSDRQHIYAAIAAIIGEREYELADSHTSSGGKYCCVNLTTTVESEEMRNKFYTHLRAHTDIKIVL